MRKLYEGSYTFTPAAGTIVFDTALVPNPAQLFLIINLSRRITMYNFVDPALGGTYEGGILELSIDTTSMYPDDALMILYEPLSSDLNTPATEATMQTLLDMVITLLDRTEFGLNTDAGKRLKVTLVDSGALGTVSTVTTVTTVTTVATMTNQARSGDVQCQRYYEALAESAYNLGILNHITF